MWHFAVCPERRRPGGQAKHKLAIQAVGQKNPGELLQGSSQALKGRGLSEVGRHPWVSEAAYDRAEQRGFVPGQELNDGLAAEIQIDRALCGPVAKKTSRRSRRI
jgi:hypothetical protein